MKLLKLFVFLHFIYRVYSKYWTIREFHRFWYLKFAFYLAFLIVLVLEAIINRASARVSFYSFHIVSRLESKDIVSNRFLRSETSRKTFAKFPIFVWNTSHERALLNLSVNPILVILKVWGLLRDRGSIDDTRVMKEW